MGGTVPGVCAGVGKQKGWRDGVRLITRVGFEVCGRFVRLQVRAYKKGSSLFGNDFFNRQEASAATDRGCSWAEAAAGVEDRNWARILGFACPRIQDLLAFRT